jgi:hypothetical protein
MKLHVNTTIEEAPNEKRVLTLISSFIHSNDSEGTGSYMTKCNGVKSRLTLLGCGKWNSQSLVLFTKKGANKKKSGTATGT